LFVGAFVPIYDYFMKPRYGYGIIEFITMENRVANYLDQNAQVGTYKAVGKVDAITVPLQVLSRDPPQLAFGLGIGNVSDSALGVQFSGEHFQRYGHFVQSGLALLLWETGLLGTGLLLALMLMLFIDAYHLSRRDDFIGAVALGMLGAITVVTLSLPYTVGMDSPALSYLFWYTAGIVAAERCRALAEAPAETRPARPVGAGLTHRPA
jgi:hypothetical protein